MLSKTSVLYEPKGKAREYSEIAVNLYRGCTHRCEYCYAPATLRLKKENFSVSVLRDNILKKLEKDALKLYLENEIGPVLLCFTCDPYQPIDDEYQISRQAIQILHQYNIRVTILTKGGKRAERDFDLLSKIDWFGVTLTNLEDSTSIQWEPGAALPKDRINSLRKANKKGINTWVSLEPVLYPEVTLNIIKKTHKFVDKYKVGILNYHPHSKDIDWHKFAVEVDNLLQELGCDYYLKNDLRRWL